jgi:putative transposase
VLLRREGHAVNKKWVYRLYRQERLMVRRRGGRRRAFGARSPMPVPSGPNRRWSVDFVYDQMTMGARSGLWRWSTTARATPNGTSALTIS